MIKADFTIEGGEAIRRAFKEAPSALQERWFVTLRKALFKGQRIIQTRYRGAARTSATATRQGTGTLRASYGVKAGRVAGGVEGELGLSRASARGAALQYGFVHEEGAVITGKGKKLAIPLPTIRSPSGIAPRPADFPKDELFVIKGRFAGGVLARRLPGGGVQPLFALRSTVTIPARPPGGAINAALREVEPDMLAELERDAINVLGGP